MWLILVGLALCAVQPVWAEGDQGQLAEDVKELKRDVKRLERQTRSSRSRRFLPNGK